MTAIVAVVGPSSAAEAPVGLGTAASFAVLGGTGVTNTGPSVLSGDLGSCPTPAMTGFAGPPDGTVLGTIHGNDAVACGAQSDLTIAYNDAAGRAPTITYAGPKDLVGLTLTAGVYKSPTAFSNAGTLTLDAQGDPGAVFVFQAGSTVITATNSRITMINGALPCNVFWQVGSSATLGVGSTFVGTILALTSITANTNAVIQGRLLARNGAVTLDTNVVTASTCPITTTTEAPGGSTTTTVAGGSGGTTTTVAGGSGGTTTTVAGGSGGTTTTVAGAGGGATTTLAPGGGAETTTVAGGGGTTTTLRTAAPPGPGTTTTITDRSRGPGGPGTPTPPSLPRTGSATQAKGLASALILMVGGSLLLVAKPRRNYQQIPIPAIADDSADPARRRQSL